MNTTAPGVFAGMAMEQLKNKLVQKLQNTKFLKELREFDSLIKAIGECKSKSEEDRIILAEIETLKQRLADPKIDKSRGKEYMVRLIYCEMLGHDTSWAYVKALQFASEPNILTKKAAYLALTQFFDHSHELVLLLVNTLHSDLKSDNFINVCTALVVCTKLIGPELINAVYPLVVDKLKHPKEHVRKKAIMALHRFHQLDPRREGPLAGVDLDKHFRTMLCDKDPSVMSAALCALHEVIKADPAPYKNLIPSFTSILKQVSEHRLPKSFDYHRFPAPFIQIKLLKVMALLGAGDKPASENMYAVLQQTLRRANNSHTIGNAIIFECVSTITTIFPNPHLLSAAADAVATFLRSSSHNLRYVGVDALAGIIKINPQAAQDHQLAVVDCLEDPDDTLKLKTLELLYKMTKAANVEVIVERMISYLRTVTDEHIKKDIARKVSELAERYAPSPAWFVRVVSEVLELGGDHVDDSLLHSLSRLIAEQDTELHRSAAEQYSKLLDVAAGRNLPDVLLRVVVWVLGEYGSLLATSSAAPPITAAQLQTKLVSLVSRQNCSDTVRQMLPCALAKICVQAGVGLSPEAESWVHKAAASQSLELQQRAYELQAILTAPVQVQQGVLPHDASCEEIDDQEMQQLQGLTFLNWYVEQALQSGASPYQPHQHAAAHLGGAAGADRSGGGLRFEAYQPAALPSSSTSQNGAAGSDPFFTSHPTSTSHPAAASSQPQLTASAAGKAAGRWGPPQFEAPARSSPAASSAAAPADFLGDFSHGAASSRSPARSRESAAQQASNQRDKMAASLFAGLGAQPGGRQPSGSVTGGKGPQGAGAAAPAAVRSPVGVDLLALDDSPRVAAAAQPVSQAPTSAQALDLLMDLTGGVQSPVPAAGGGMGVGGAQGGLDSLLNWSPQPVAPASSTNAYGSPGLGGGVLGGFGGAAAAGFNLLGSPSPAGGLSPGLGGVQQQQLRPTVGVMAGGNGMQPSDPFGFAMGGGNGMQMGGQGRQLIS